MITSNWFAPIVLFAWPIVAFGLYRLLPVGNATLWTILGAELLLPPGLYYKIPTIPVLDKDFISSISALLGVFFVAPKHVKFFRRFGAAEVLICVFIFSPVITSLLNTDPIYGKNIVLPGVDYYDGLSAALSQFVLLLPFFLGRQLFRSSENHAEVLRVLVAAMLFYSLPMLFELRMSPILNIWIYGYAPSEMQQAFRDGGYRPMVFMGHGLGVAFFTMMATIAASALWRSRTRLRWFPPSAATAYLGTLLVLCKSAASLVYGGLCTFLILFTRPRLQIRVALLVTTVALLYPLLRSADLIPTKEILSAVSSISSDRAGSLRTRFDSEDVLLQHAQERFVFGWGRYGRSRNYGAGGGFTSTTDGAWIITVGTSGLVGFLALFGVLALPVFRAMSALRLTESSTDAIHIGALTLILSMNIFDLLPNAGLTPWTWLLAGALLGRTEALTVAARYPRSSQPAVSRPSIETSR